MVRRAFDIALWAFWPAYAIAAKYVGWSTIRENWEWAAGTTVVAGIVFFVLWEIDKYMDTKGIVGCYKRTKDVTPDDFLITKFNENYLRRKSDDLMEQELDESKYVLLKGIPMIGKTRAVYEMVKRLSKYYLIKIPITGEVKINFKDAGKIRLPLGKKRIVMVFDDLDKYVTKKDLIDFDAVISRLKEKSKDLKVIATCRSGDEYKRFRSAAEELRFCDDLELVEAERLTGEQAERLGRLVGKDVSRIKHDNTPGAIVIDLEKMKKKYLEGRETGYHLVLHSLRLLKDGNIFWAEEDFVKETAKRVFKLDEKTDWFDALQWNLANGFIQRLNGRITAVHDCYVDDEFLEDFERDELEEKLKVVTQIAKDLKYVDSVFELGSSFVDRKEYDAAIDCFSSVIAIRPHTPEAHYNIGLAYSKKSVRMRDPTLAEEWLDLAIVQLREALEARPNYPWAHYILALVYTAKCHYPGAPPTLVDDAIWQFREALRIKPDFYQVHVGLALVYDARGLFDAGIDECNKALRIKPDFAEAHHKLATGLEKKDKTAALRQWKRYLEVAKNDPEHLKLIPEAEQHIRRLEEEQ